MKWPTDCAVCVGVRNGDEGVVTAYVAGWAMGVAGAHETARGTLCARHRKMADEQIEVLEKVSEAMSGAS